MSCPTFTLRIATFAPALGNLKIRTSAPSAGNIKICNPNAVGPVQVVALPITTYLGAGAYVVLNTVNEIEVTGAFGDPWKIETDGDVLDITLNDGSPATVDLVDL